MGVEIVKYIHCATDYLDLDWLTRSSVGINVTRSPCDTFKSVTACHAHACLGLVARGCMPGLTSFCFHRILVSLYFIVSDISHISICKFVASLFVRNVLYGGKTCHHTSIPTS